MSIGVAHAHADGAPYSAIAMCPPHLVLKWTREVLITVPRARAFVIYDLRNGGDPTRPHGVVEVQLHSGHAVTRGLKTSLYEMRAMGRQGWRKHCPGPAYFIVSRETGKLSYHWKHAFAVAKSGPEAVSSRASISTSGSTRRRSPGESRGRRSSPHCGKRIGRRSSAWRRLSTSAVT